MANVEKIYEYANDQHVRAFVVYKKANQTKAYVDSAFTEQFTTSALKDAFIKGALIKLDDGSLVKPFKYAESSSIGSIYYTVPNGTTATSGDIASLVAVADPED